MRPIRVPFDLCTICTGQFRLARCLSEGVSDEPSQELQAQHTLAAAHIVPPRAPRARMQSARTTSNVPRMAMPEF